MTTGTNTKANNPTVPDLGFPFVNEEGIISLPWYRLLIDLLRRTGGSQYSVPSAVYFVLSSLGLTAYLVDTNKSLGNIITTLSPGGAAVPAAPVTSPFVYQAAGAGTLLVESGQVEMSRDGVNWYVFGLAGGAISLRSGDSVRVTWYNVVPKITWMPS